MRNENNTNSYRENEALSDISRKIFHVTIVLRLNILWLKTVNEITARQTVASLSKHDVIKVCHKKYLTTQIELVLPTFKSWAVHKIIEYLTLGLLSSLWNIYHCTTAYFSGPPCIYAMHTMRPNNNNNKHGLSAAKQMITRSNNKCTTRHITNSWTKAHCWAL